MRYNPRAGSAVRRIPSLDGLRALSIGLVLVFHSAPNNSPHPFLWILGNGDLGVSIFFVISGFLITSLLLEEHGDTGTISLKTFYLRRAFRILPPFYTFLIVILVLRQLGILNLSLHAWVQALLFPAETIYGRATGGRRDECIPGSISEHRRAILPAVGRLVLC